MYCIIYSRERCQKIMAGNNHFERPAKQMSYFFHYYEPSYLFSTDLEFNRWDFELQGSYRVLNSWKSLVSLPTNLVFTKYGKKVLNFYSKL